MGSKYFLSTYIVLLFLIVYIPLALYPRFKGAEEIYPFFSWNLFHKTPYVIKEFGIEAQNHLVQQRGSISRNAASSNRFTLIQKIGYYYQKKSKKELATIRKVFEADYMQGVTTYNLMLLQYDPVERWNTNNYRMKKIVKTFTIGDYN